MIKENFLLWKQTNPQDLFPKKYISKITISRKIIGFYLSFDLQIAFHDGHTWADVTPKSCAPSVIEKFQRSRQRWQSQGILLTKLLKIQTNHWSVTPFVMLSINCISEISFSPKWMKCF